ncbi:MAG TPA: sigma-70 family RNA polymerase sigma factor [Pirellulaceae bacterium]|nr:sigma-70 family RNA polymerase sigma factor [Pirellulaceae bacterium]
MRFSLVDLGSTSVNGAASESSSSTSPSLIQRARAQDPEAWRRLSRLYTPLVYGWARQSGLSASDAADIVQEVFRSVVTNIDRFRHDELKSSFRGWLWTITRNQVRLHFRQLSNRPDVTGGTEHHQQVEQLPDLLEQEAEPSSSDAKKSLVHRALRIVRNDFEEKTWQAFWRLTVDGHSAAEIAAELDMNPRSVRQAKYRILARLRQELADQ